MIVEVLMVCATVVACFWIRSGHGHDVDDVVSDLESLNARARDAQAAANEVKQVVEHIVKSVAAHEETLRKVRQAASNGALKGSFGG